AVFWRALVLAVVAGIVLALLSPLFIRAGIWFLAAEPAVNEAMATYIGIRILAAPFALANYAILGYVLGRGEAALGLGLQIVRNGTNVVLSIICGRDFGWGSGGVACGTVCGEVIAALVGMAILYPRFRKGARPSLQRIG